MRVFNEYKIFKYILTFKIKKFIKMCFKFNFKH